MLSAALTYFAVVFGAGFVLGPIRVLVLVPRLGERVAELLEAPVMLTVIVAAARWVVRRYGGEVGPHGLLRVGMMALGLVLGAELAVGLSLGGLTPSEVYLGKDPVSGTVYYALLAAYAVLPWALARRQPPIRNSR